MGSENNKDRKQGKKTSKFNIKKHIRDFLVFASKNLFGKMKILLIIAILLIAIVIKPICTTVLAEECVGGCLDGVTFIARLKDTMGVLLVTGVAAIVPYIYAPIVGFLGFVLKEVGTLAYIIKAYGYLGGTLLGALPLILSICAISLVTALGIYICKSITVGYKISSTKNMNWLNFRIQLYETLGKTERVNELTKRKEAKLKKLKEEKKEIEYMQILNVAIVACVLQVVAILLQHIVM